MLNLPPSDDEEKRNLLAATTVLVRPSRVESLGVDWANGKPVIEADTAVSREVIVDQADGPLVPFGEVSAIATAIERLLRNPKECNRMGDLGKGKVYS